VNYVSINLSFKVPAMYLARYHKIGLVGFQWKPFEIDGMSACAPGKQYKMVKRMAVRTVEVLVVFFQVGAKTFNQQIAISTFLIDGADVVNWYGRFSHNAS
jgi:hypothetical protein